MNRKWLIALVLLAVAAGAGGYYWYRKVNGDTTALTLHGNVEVRQVNLGFKVSGRIEKLRAEEGDEVAEGQTLASLEKVYFEDALAQARAQRDQAAANAAKLEAGNRPEEIAQARAVLAEREAALTNAKITRERAEHLLKSKVGTQKAFDDAAAAERQAEALRNSAMESLRLMESGFRKEDIDLARAQLADRDTQVKVAERQLADADLVAPNAGTILSRVRETGAIVAAGDTVYVLSLTRPVWVRTYVSEPDLGRVRPGMAVVVRTDVPGGKVYRGRVGFISTAAEFTPKTVETSELRTALVYRLRMVVDGDASELRQGMPVTVIVPLTAEKAPRVATGDRAP